jgi:hypothetical protein
MDPDDVDVPVLFDNIITNEGNNFDGSTYICPITGLFMFSISTRSGLDIKVV